MSRRVQVIERDTAPSRSAPTDTGPAFLAAITEKGLFDPLQPCRSMDDFERHFGTRQSYSVGWDWAETFFREGGNLLHVTPVRGPSPVIASLNLVGAVGTVLVAAAKSAGEWANGAAGGLSVEVANGPSGATHRVLIVRLNAVEVERTPEFTTQAEAIAWSAGSDYVNVTLGGGTPGLPTVAAAANLTAGTLDRTNITQTQISAAVDLFTADLGPGQVVSPDWQTEAAHEALLDHAATRNRYALLDPTDTTAKATLLTAAGLVQGHANGDHGSLVAPWLSIAGTAGGASRSVPASAFIAAKAAETDVSEGANQAPAGDFGVARSSLVLSAKANFSDSDAEDLEEAGVNLIINRYGTVRFDGNRTLVEPLGGDAEWLQMSNARYRMRVIARATVIGEGYEHRRITPNTIAAFDTALTGMMLADLDQLYPGEDDPGFIVDTGPGVNTPELVGAGTLSAAIGFRPAPGADLVYIYLSKVAVGDSIG